ncbi:hypothetical protein TNCV_397761 [Trichonephila clavipes]|nr:hypothetical protein TNCV_397761 [Trichonephila clavipes]
MNILHVSESVQIPDDPESAQIPVSHVPQPPMQILPEPMNILHVPQHVQIPVSHVPQPPMQILPKPMNILHVSEPVQIPVSQVPQPPMQILHVSEPVQIPVSQVPQSPVQIPPVQLLPESTCWALWSRQMHSTSSCRSYLDPQRTPAAFTHGTLFDENLFLLPG